MCNNNNLQLNSEPLSVLPDQVDTCGCLDGKNFDTGKILAFGGCLYPAVVGDTKSGEQSKMIKFYHDSWFSKQDTHSDIDTSTFLLCDSVGGLMGTGSRFTPYLESDIMVNTTELKATLSVYKVSDVFGCRSEYIFQIRGCVDQYVNGIYHACWHREFKVHVIQKKIEGWGGSCSWLMHLLS